MTVTDGTPQSASGREASTRSRVPAASLWAAILNFLKFGANSDPGARHTLFYRHTLPVRIAHWINAVVIVIMFMSGLQIFNAHPALYWGITSDFANPVLSMTGRMVDGAPHGFTQIGPWIFDTTGWLGASQVNGQWMARGFPSWITLPGQQWLAMGRQWHLFFAWFFAINGVLFAIYAFVSRHFKRDLLPAMRDIRNIPREIADHARLRFHHGQTAKRYNALQKISYFIVIFLLGPLVVLTGLTMSPTLDSAFPFLLWIFGGRQSARTIHFLCAFSFFGFFFIHIAMVILAGTWNNIRSMITGWFAIEEGGKHG